MRAAGGILLGGSSGSAALHGSVLRGNSAAGYGTAIVSDSAGFLTMDAGSSAVAGGGGGGGELVTAPACCAVGLGGRLTCGPGESLLVPLNATAAVPLDAWSDRCGPVILRGVRVACAGCAAGQYGLGAGSVTGFDAAGVVNVECLPCPYGGACVGGAVTPLPGYWGAVVGRAPAGGASGAGSGDTVAFTVCPAGYCCGGDDGASPCVALAACAATRAGQLCGDCAAGHGEAFGGPGCVPDADCNDAGWAVPAFALLAAAYAAYFVSKTAGASSIFAHAPPPHRRATTLSLHSVGDDDAAPAAPALGSIQQGVPMARATSGAAAASEALSRVTREEAQGGDAAAADALSVIERLIAYFLQVRVRVKLLCPCALWGACSCKCAHAWRPCVLPHVNNLI